MADKVVIRLNPSQKAKIEKKLGRVCDTLEVDKDDLINMVRYVSPQICIDFDDAQEKVVQKAFPGKECDFAIIDKSDLGGIVKYMPPPGSPPSSK
jgi:hypothetical protein